MPPTAPTTNGSNDHTPNVEMKDSPPSNIHPDFLFNSEPAPHATQTAVTPTGSTIATTTTATAAALPMAPPTLPSPHGAQARIYLNSKVTPYLLEGVKSLASERPEKPLEWLAEFLKKKSEEVEGTGEELSS